MLEYKILRIYDSHGTKCADIASTQHEGVVHPQYPYANFFNKNDGGKGRVWKLVGQAKPDFKPGDRVVYKPDQPNAPSSGRTATVMNLVAPGKYVNWEVQVNWDDVGPGSALADAFKLINRPPEVEEVEPEVQVIEI